MKNASRSIATLIHDPAGVATTPLTSHHGAMRVVSWNVNGLRAADRDRRFRRFLDRSEAWLVGIQEVRATAEQLPRRLTAPKGWHAFYSSAEKKGYSGVGLFCRDRPDDVETSLGRSEFDREGRLQIAHIGKLSVANVYFPNGSGPGRDHSRVPYKLDFYARLFDRVDELRRAGQRVLVMGDFNTACEEIDLARPKANRKTSGFLDVERDELRRWLASGWVDTFRSRNADTGHYTWWSQRFGVREKNIGWRIDYVLACAAADQRVESAFIWPRVKGSDHCPLGVDLDSRILK